MHLLYSGREGRAASSRVDAPFSSKPEHGPLKRSEFQEHSKEFSKISSSSSFFLRWGRSGRSQFSSYDTKKKYPIMQCGFFRFHMGYLFSLFSVMICSLSYPYGADGGSQMKFSFDFYRRSLVSRIFI